MNTETLKVQELQLKLEKLESLLNIYMHDKLTGLLMRRDFDYKFAEFFEANEEFYLTLVDVNGLHELNRKNGYDAGDDLITNVAHKLTIMCDNVVYRIGGDEFGIFSYTNPCYIKDKNFCMATTSSKDFKSMRDMFNSVDEKIIDLKKELYKGSKDRRN